LFDRGRTERQLYSVTAIGETVQKTNLGNWVVGDNLNQKSHEIRRPPTDIWYKVTWTKQEHALKLKKPTVVGIIL
jgi:hypothetical protein